MQQSTSNLYDCLNDIRYAYLYSQNISLAHWVEVRYSIHHHSTLITQPFLSCVFLVVQRSVLFQAEQNLAEVIELFSEGYALKEIVFEGLVEGFVRACRIFGFRTQIDLNAFNYILTNLVFQVDLRELLLIHGLNRSKMIQLFFNLLAKFIDFVVNEYSNVGKAKFIDFLELLALVGLMVVYVARQDLFLTAYAVLEVLAYFSLARSAGNVLRSSCEQSAVRGVVGAGSVVGGIHSFLRGGLLPFFFLVAHSQVYE